MRFLKLLGTPFFLSVALIAIASLSPAAGPASRPAELRADRELNAQLTKLETEFRSKKVDALRKYVTQLTAEKAAATRAKDREAVQRIFDAIADANAKIGELVPPAGPAAQLPAVNISVKEVLRLTNAKKTVDLDLSTISAIDGNDPGPQPKVLWESKLTAAQQDRLAKFARTFPLNNLANSYEDRGVSDGFTLEFTIQLGGAPARKITLENCHQFYLDHLIDEINELLPPKYWLSKWGQ